MFINGLICVCTSLKLKYMDFGNPSISVVTYGTSVTYGTPYLIVNAQDGVSPYERMGYITIYSAQICTIVPSATGKNLNFQNDLVKCFLLFSSSQIHSIKVSMECPRFSTIISSENSCKVSTLYFFSFYGLD